MHLFRYVVGSNRALFVLKDGSQAWDVKNFLVAQDRCEVVTIEGKDYPGKGASKVDLLAVEFCVYFHSSHFFYFVSYNGTEAEFNFRWRGYQIPASLP